MFGVGGFLIGASGAVLTTPRWRRRQDGLLARQLSSPFSTLFKIPPTTATAATALRRPRPIVLVVERCPGSRCLHLLRWRRSGVRGCRAVGYRGSWWRGSSGRGGRRHCAWGELWSHARNVGRGAVYVTADNLCFGEVTPIVTTPGDSSCVKARDGWARTNGGRSAHRSAWTHE